MLTRAQPRFLGNRNLLLFPSFRLCILHIAVASITRHLRNTDRSSADYTHSSLYHVDVVNLFGHTGLLSSRLRSPTNHFAYVTAYMAFHWCLMAGLTGIWI